MKQAAFQATIHGFRTVPSRGVVSITIEAPIEHHAEIAKIAVHGAWVAVARLQEPSKEVVPNAQQLSAAIDARPGQNLQPRSDRAKRDWRELAPQQQAGIRCEEPIFAAFLKEKYYHTWQFLANSNAAECVRMICHVSSRAELATNHKARVIWKQLDDEYQAWKALEHA